MAFRHLNELPLGDRIFRIELASDDDSTVTLTLTGWQEDAPETLLASGALTLPLTDVPALRIALNRALRALALVADVAEPIPDRDVLRELFPGHGAPWVPQHEEDLTQRFHAGETIARIAARFGRTPDSVRTKLRELGHDPRRPDHCPPDGCLSWSRYASPALVGAGAPAAPEAEEAPRG
ncbi:MULTISPECIES: hypothetical protein [Streptomyces]|uniref:Uncharacterized protein n=2 Tax=Streptomyces TaxID=1883 RepID=A0A3R7EXI2_9ACTN|nr:MULTISPECIES: hypothetical protein [Streptomyces]MZE78820.1 hypothetical protein [Streptomyces sp. SID5475]KNE82739.1 hypothetical protein ADZ36_08825 [Streptomyces fradiae]MCC3651483.1 hypothetical protein [Streptomyces sp. S07_1.15]OFA42149.1 hypothetical protein BEN35_24145 [Streptomyces fradiae]PQM24465.1 hypothetical protein Sfr7A_06880 [Streptomyces xinghaiensis]